MRACQPLREYAWFVGEVRRRQTELNDFEAAVDAALMEMPEDYAIKGFLSANRAEVKRMCITEYNEIKTLADERQEGAVMMLFNLVKKGLLTDTILNPNIDNPAASFPLCLR